MARSPSPRGVRRPPSTGTIEELRGLFSCGTQTGEPTGRYNPAAAGRGLPETSGSESL
jgi:hypothetical protein